MVDKEYEMTWQEYCAEQEEHDKAMNHYDEDGFCIYCAKHREDGIHHQCWKH